EGADGAVGFPAGAAEERQRGGVGDRHPRDPPGGAPQGLQVRRGGQQSAAVPAPPPPGFHEQGADQCDFGRVGGQAAVRGGELGFGCGAGGAEADGPGPFGGDHDLGGTVFEGVLPLLFGFLLGQVVEHFRWQQFRVRGAPGAQLDAGDLGGVTWCCGADSGFGHAANLACSGLHRERFAGGCRGGVAACGACERSVLPTPAAWCCGRRGSPVVVPGPVRVVGRCPGCCPGSGCCSWIRSTWRCGRTTCRCSAGWGRTRGSCSTRSRGSPPRPGLGCSSSTGRTRRACFRSPTGRCCAGGCGIAGVRGGAAAGSCWSRTPSSSLTCWPRSRSWARWGPGPWSGSSGRTARASGARGGTAAAPSGCASCCSPRGS